MNLNCFCLKIRASNIVKGIKSSLQNLYYHYFFFAQCQFLGAYNPSLDPTTFQLCIRTLFNSKMKTLEEAHVNAKDYCSTVENILGYFQ